MIFEDRCHAGKLLAENLRKVDFDRKNAIVAAIPRGGVVIGEEISKALKIPLAVIVIKKLGAPGNSELAIGATASRGEPVLDRWLMRDLDVNSDYLKKEIATKKKEAAARERYLGFELSPSDFAGKDVILVDDGLATGQTAKAAAKIIKKFGPERLVLAIPCASPSTINLVKGDFDEVVCLEASEELYAVGQFYQDFRPIEDLEVREILDRTRTKTG